MAGSKDSSLVDLRISAAGNKKEWHRQQQQSGTIGFSSCFDFTDFNDLML